MTAPTYLPLHPAVLSEQNDHALFQSVYEHVAGRIPGAWNYADTDQLLDIPVPMVMTWRLWWFAAEVGGNGLPDYFLNHCRSVEEARAYLEALEAVGASELAVMFRDSALLAVAIEGEIAFLPGADWFVSLGSSGQWPALEEMELPSMQLAADPLSHLVAEYLRAAHRAGEI